MRVAIIGAGISGLTIGRLLQENGFDVILFEKGVEIGGIARTKVAGEIAYHVTGGHCFNSKHQDVLDFVFNRILPKENWHNVERRSSISFKGHRVSYPIEFAIREIAQFDLGLATQMVKDYFSTGLEDRTNLANWFRSKFGNTLAEEYFIPYNEKIWNQKASFMSPDWVDGKLPMPDKEGFAKALLSFNKDAMPHSTFYYPNTNTQNSFIDALGEGLSIELNFSIESIQYLGDKWRLNDIYEFDLVVSTAPLNLLPSLFENTPLDVSNAAAKLKYNKVSTMLWRTSGNSDTWTYHPDQNTLFHRHIHIGNFFSPAVNCSITEAVGEHSFDTMRREGLKFDYLLEPIDHHVSDHAYVVFDQNHHQSKKIIMDYLADLHGFYTLGRFGEWEYYNMDICIKSAIELSKKITFKFSAG